MLDSPTPDLPNTVPTPRASGDETVHRTTEFGPTGGSRRRQPRYLIGEEVARGGMAVVYRGQDTQLRREVAIKVTLPGQDVKRFVTEARITARLPHPGIPPVYSLGQLSGKRMCLAMKFVAGGTLADELATGRSDRAALVSAFERVCEAVGFAHSNSIVHRDLKPANVMLGGHGEVYVMDWGLAKDIGAPRREGREEPRNESQPAAPSGPDTVVGEVQGTPAYMAPEQARGEKVDARADVFALGGILAAILTGKAPFGGTTVIDTVLQAAQAELDECFARLDGCGADAELVAIAKTCLAAEPAGRYADGSAVAVAVAKYRAGVEDRLKAAERERAAAEARAAEAVNTRHEAEARAAEGRKRHRAQQALAAAVAVLALGAVSFAAWREREKGEQARIEGERKTAEARADAEAEFKGQQARQGIDANLKLAADLRKQYKFREAGAALGQAAELARGGAPERLDEVAQAQRDLALVVKLDDIRYHKWMWVAKAGGGGNFNVRSAPPEYQAAFAAYGLNLVELPPADAAARIAASPVRAELVAAVDDWALFVFDPTGATQRRLLEATRRADPNPWTDRLRNVDTWRDPVALRRLAAEVEPARVSAAAVAMLTELMVRQRLDPSAVFSAARVEKPSDFDLAFTLGVWWQVSGVTDGRQVGAFEAARALRADSPAVWGALGTVLGHRGDLSGAVRAYRRALELDPGLALVHVNLGEALRVLGQFDEALALLDRATALDPKLAAAYFQRAVVLYHKGQRERALADLDQGVKLDPWNAAAYSALGFVRGESGDRTGALAALERAAQLDPKRAAAQHELATELVRRGDREGAIAALKRARDLEPNNAAVHRDLGLLLVFKGSLDEAEAALRLAIQMNHWDALAQLSLGGLNVIRNRPEEALACAQAALQLNLSSDMLSSAHAIRGLALQQLGRFVEARAALAEAVRLNKSAWSLKFEEVSALFVAPPPRVRGADPTNPTALLAHGHSLRAAGKYAEAEKAYRQALALTPEDATAHNYLGLALDSQKDYAGAERSYRKGTELDPTFAVAHSNLAIVLRRQKKFPEALASARTALELNPLLATAHVTIGYTLQETGDLEGAGLAFAAAARLNPKAHGPLVQTVVTALIARGNQFRGERRYADATKAFRAAVMLAPQNADAHNYLGLALDAQKQHRAAEQSYRAAIRLRDTFASAHSNLAITLRRQNRYEEGLAAAARALELDPNLSHAHATIGRTWEALGDPDRARRAFVEAARLDPRAYGYLIDDHLAPVPREVIRP